MTFASAAAFLFSALVSSLVTAFNSAFLAINPHAERSGADLASRYGRES